MSTTFIATVPSPEQVKNQYPISLDLAVFVAKKIESLKRILDGRDPRKILIVGPCSADFEDSLLEYARRLRGLQERVGDSLELVMRFYTGKPRTVGGWKGLSHSQPGESPSVTQGIPNARRIALRLLAEGVALADEMLHPQMMPFFADLFSWVAVGARSTENQYHREVASGLDCPVGFKNPTSGSLVVMNNSVEAAQKSTHFVDPWTGHEFVTSGNPWAHGILRGGECGSNFSLQDIEGWRADIAKRPFVTVGNSPALIIDCSHENCVVNGKKDFSQQAEVLREVTESVIPPLVKKGCDPIKGFMLESYLQPGNSCFLEDHRTAFGAPGSKRGLSLTDPCLSWNQTEAAVLRCAQSLTRTRTKK